MAPKLQRSDPNAGFHLLLLTTGLLVSCTAADVDRAREVPAAADTTEALPVLAKGELDYLRSYAGKYAYQEGVFMSYPLRQRLDALLGPSRTIFLSDLDVQGPILVHGDTAAISGCRAHACNTHGSIVVVDLAGDNIVAGHREDGHVAYYTEKPLAPDALPRDLVEWAGRDPVAPGTRAHALTPVATKDTFGWGDLAKATEGTIYRLRGIRSGVHGTLYDELLTDARKGCLVRVCEFDLDVDGRPEMLVSRSNCAEWCGSAGCNVTVYEGGRSGLSINDEADLLKPGRNGIITSKGVLLELR